MSNPNYWYGKAGAFWFAYEKAVGGPEADLIITPDSGHSAFDPPNSRALVAATDKFAFC